MSKHKWDNGWICKRCGLRRYDCRVSEAPNITFGPTSMKYVYGYEPGRLFRKRPECKVI